MSNRKTTWYDFIYCFGNYVFFFAFFWAFFHSSLAPVYNIGGVWPPQSITPLYPSLIPLTNTYILLSSGAVVTWAHHAIILNAKRHTIISLSYTIVLAALFTYFQGVEYVTAAFNISDGFHVFVGTLALIVSFIRLVFNHFTNTQHFGFESAIWYWHFVDVVWLFLFINVYWWGNYINYIV